jgi:hypothetical protein
LLSKDFARLDKILQMLAVVESRAQDPMDEEDAYVLAGCAAYELQQLYTGFEKIIERHFGFKGLKPPSSDRYHKEPLRHAFENDLVIHKVNREFLLDLLGFGHFVRSAYGVGLDTAETFRKAKMAKKRWPVIAAKLRQEVGLGKAS